MKISFRSVPILSDVNLPQGGANMRVTTFQIQDVRRHTLEISFAQLLFGQRPFWIGMFAWGWSLLALWYVVDTDVMSSPLLFFGGGALSFGVIQWVVWMLSKEWAMQACARKERGTPADQQLKVVQDSEWEDFRSRLK